MRPFVFDHDLARLAVQSFASARPAQRRSQNVVGRNQQQTMTSRRAPSASTSRVALVATAGPVRRAAASNRPPFRKSLIQVGEDYQNFDWQERDNLTRRPAQSALAGLLQVGEEDDIIGLDAGRINRYEAFKSAYIHFSQRECPCSDPDELV